MKHIFNYKILLFCLFCWILALISGILYPKLIHSYSITSKPASITFYSKTGSENLNIETLLLSANETSFRINSCFYEENSTIYTTLNPESLTAIVDKFHKIPPEYKPSDLELLSKDESMGGNDIYLRKEVLENLKKILADSKEAGFRSSIISGWRSSDQQTKTFSKWINLQNLEIAGNYAAKSGHSEHQLGTAIDINMYSIATGKKNYSWLEENAGNYGFVLSYPKNKYFITGYYYEPWHYRYVGVEAAMQIYKENITLSEFLYKSNGICK